MEIAKLLAKLAQYYSSRGFPANAVATLQRHIVDHVRPVDGDYEIGAIGPLLLSPARRVSALLEKLPERPFAPGASASSAQAIFSFAFGYRLKSRVAPGEERRLPGLNNRRLAEISANAKRTHPHLKLCAQFEIADALADYTDVQADVSTLAKDIGTRAVIEQMLAALDPKPQRVVVIAHRHHLDRCHIILRGDPFGLDTLDADEFYCDYDPLEAQERVKSAEDCIVSDFVSLAARV